MPEFCIAYPAETHAFGPLPRVVGMSRSRQILHPAIIRKGHCPVVLADTPEKMKALDAAFAFSNSGNSEILAAWFEKSIRNGYSAEIMPQIEAFLTRVGRRKFLTPLYRAFKESGQLEKAREIYAQAEPNYHAVSRNTIRQLLELDS